MDNCYGNDKTMKRMKFQFGVGLLCSVLLLTSVLTASAKPAATRFDHANHTLPPIGSFREQPGHLDALGDPLDFEISLQTAATYLRRFQADITDDNAENGVQGVNETPDDPDDGGWDWVLNWVADPHSHSSASSPNNLYGTVAFGALRAFQRSGEYGLWVALVDAADIMVAADTASMRTAADIKFLMLLDDQYDIEIGPTSVYSDAAREKYDHIINSYGSATALAQSIRDVRGVTQGYPNGIIAWDVGAFAVVAQMLFDRYGGTYHQDAVDIAEVLFQDSYNDNPGYFDVVDDAGWDPGYANVNYWWYTLGITGLLDAFDASNTHSEVLNDLTARLLESQYSNGAFSFCFGANSEDHDWQSSAYAVMSLHNSDSVQFEQEVCNGSYWIGATQSVDGGWLYSNNDHYPAIGGENTAALSYGKPADTVYVDDDWSSQANVDVYNLANNSKLVWGYSAFGLIRNSFVGTNSRTVYIRAGLYLGQVHPRNFENLTIIGAGVDSTILRAPATTMPDIYFAGGPSRPILFIDNSTADVSNLTIDGDGRGSNNSRMIGVAFWNSEGIISDAAILNVRDTPLNNGSQGVGISVNHNNGLPQDVTVRDVYIAGFQKNGTGFSGLGTNVTCENVTVVGLGPTTTVIQNGIQYSPGTTGTITDCSVSGIIWSGSLWVASSILMFESDQVDISSTTVSNCQTGIYAVDADCSIENSSVTTSPSASLAGKSGVRFYASLGALASQRDMPQRYVETVENEERARDRVLDEDEVVTVNNVTITGNLSANSYGILVQADGGTLDLSVSNCSIIDWSRGIDISASNVNAVTDVTIQNNRLSNIINAFDNRSNHVWDSNCYSDYTSNFGFPGSYEISGAVPWNLDSNPNPNGCYDVNLITDGNLIGCGGSECAAGEICLTLGTAGLPNLQLTLQLPAGYVSGLPPTGAVATPQSDADSCLIQAFAIDLGGGLVQVDIGFQSPGSSGDIGKTVACIPIINMSNGTGIQAAQLNSSLWIDIGGGEHPNDLDLGVGVVRVDCGSPIISAVSSQMSCAFGSASQTQDVFSATFSDALSGIDSAWVTFSPSGGSFTILAEGVTSPQTFVFPSELDTALFYSQLVVDTCNTMTLHVRDAECNLATPVALASIGRDNTPPSLAVTMTDPENSCFNNTPSSPNYGGSSLDDALNITSILGPNPCAATFGYMTISHTGLVDFVVALDQLSYPTNDSSALALWDWMLDAPGFMIANGDTFTFDVTASDCAGNTSSAQQFSICVDMQLPENTFTVLDARPAHLGIWLNWSWESGTDAEEMRIYRSPLSGEYPAYPNDLWNDLANYEMASFPPTGWNLVATQSSLSGTVTSGSYTGMPNNRGDLSIHVAGLDTFWLDAEAGWNDGQGNALAHRDIYRYVTFVRDAGGNWSVGDSVEMMVNADRSTNYWLGDFSPADSSGDPFSSGRVDTDDLSLLSSVYFTNTGGFCNIGPVITENGNIGKGIPDPDAIGTIDFLDLAPFSFNFHSVSPVGITETEFVVRPDPSRSRPFSQLDQVPGIELVCPENIELKLGTEFTVGLRLTGNESDAIKAAEAVIQYDESLFELVSVSQGHSESEGGVVFSKASSIMSFQEQVGFVAAACGGESTLRGNSHIGSFTLRLISVPQHDCGVLLAGARFLDVAGSILEVGERSFNLPVQSALPSSFSLLQNYPNPFNASTVIKFDLPVSSNVQLIIYNTNGQVVESLVNERREAGHHQVNWDASSVSSGVYVYVLKSDNAVQARKMILLH